MCNRVEHQKRNQTTIARWPFGFIFAVLLDLHQTQALMKTKGNKNILLVLLIFVKFPRETSDADTDTDSDRVTD